MRPGRVSRILYIYNYYVKKIIIKKSKIRDINRDAFRFNLPYPIGVVGACGPLPPAGYGLRAPAGHAMIFIPGFRKKKTGSGTPLPSHCRNASRTSSERLQDVPVFFPSNLSGKSVSGLERFLLRSRYEVADQLQAKHNGTPCHSDHLHNVGNCQLGARCTDSLCRATACLYV